MLYIAYTIHIVVSLFLILVVLLQQGKGADLSVFGGGGTQAAFGARGAATLLHKLTVWGFVAFIVTTMAIGFLQTQRTQSSVMSGVPTEEATAVDEAAADEASMPAAPMPDVEPGEGAAAEGATEIPEPAGPAGGAEPPPGE
jgi:preprotein translocase subunit SecG